MNPSSLVTPELINYCKFQKTIVVCGYTKTGKITIARKLAEELNRPLFISDDYQFTDPVKSLYVFMEDILKVYNQGIPLIVEGILGFRLLRKGIQENNFYPDLVLKTECNEATIRHFYIKEGEGHKVEGALRFNKSLNKVWEDYQKLIYLSPWIKKPICLELNTSL